MGAASGVGYHMASSPDGSSSASVKETSKVGLGPNQLTNNTNATKASKNVHIVLSELKKSLCGSYGGLPGTALGTIDICKS